MIIYGYKRILCSSYFEIQSCGLSKGHLLHYKGHLLHSSLVFIPIGNLKFKTIFRIHIFFIPLKKINPKILKPWKKF